MESGRGLAVSGDISQTTRTVKRDKALELVDEPRGECERRVTLGADKVYDVSQFVHDLRGRSVSYISQRLSQADRRGVWLVQKLHRSGQRQAAPL